MMMGNTKHSIKSSEEAQKVSFLSETSKRKQPIKPFLKGEILLTVRLSIEHLTLKN